jgi:hypothetical protein
MNLKVGGRQKDEDGNVVLARSGQSGISMAGRSGKIKRE